MDESLLMGRALRRDVAIEPSMLFFI